MNYVITQPGPQVQRAALLDLWQRNLPGTGPERFAWLYEHGCAHSWLVQKVAGATVGSVGLLPRRLKLGTQLVTCGQAIDMNVDREHRSVGPALKLQRAVLDRARRERMPVVYGVPVPQAEAVMRRAGYRQVGPITRWAKPVRSAYLVRKYLPVRPVAAVVSCVVDQVLRWRAPERRRVLPPRWRAEILPTPDERFDQLWRTGSEALPIVGERTAAYLTWRFLSCPGMRCQLLGLLDAEEQLRGYVVFHVTPDHFARVEDFFMDTPESLEILLGAFLRRLRGDHVQAVSLSFLGTPLVTQVLERLGFVPREAEWSLLAHGSPTAREVDLPEVGRPENWFFTRADLDVAG